MSSRVDDPGLGAGTTHSSEPSAGAAPAQEAGAEGAAAVPGRPSAEIEAHAALAPALREMIEAVRRTSAYVVQSGRRRSRSPGSAAARASEPPPADAEEAVHDFRVALRRLRTVLRALRRTYGKRKLRSIGVGLKRYADATGTLRDEEVLRETLSGLQLSPEVRSRVDAWTARRLRQERARRGQVVRMLAGASDAGVHEGLERELRRIDKLLRRGPRKKPLSEVAAAATARAHQDLGLPVDTRGGVDTSALDASDALAMHALRIRFKRLRYTAELFGELLQAARGQGQPVTEPPAFADPRELGAFAKDATRMQKRLGELHDIDEALIRVARAWGLDPEARAALADALRAERARLAARALHELSRWQTRSKPSDRESTAPPR